MFTHMSHTHTNIIQTNQTFSIKVCGYNNCPKWKVGISVIEINDVVVRNINYYLTGLPLTMINQLSSCIDYNLSEKKRCNLKLYSLNIRNEINVIKPFQSIGM